MKKIFIKKSLNDLINDQNKLIEKLIVKQADGKDNDFAEAFKVFFTNMLSNKVEVSDTYNEEKEDFSFDENEILYIPKNKIGEVKLTSVNIEKKELDTSSIDKLKQAIKDSNRGGL